MKFNAVVAKLVENELKNAVVKKVDSGYEKGYVSVEATNGKIYKLAVTEMTENDGK